ncbi:thiol:disulfide interchange protein TlpA [Chthonobacter rhizosphaerae]|uniref:thiol:disulfide interchange protein TlpA n=1 Tax=Chthonobacter rhizosphaerae TaxID=2735553 RepID=UPI0015EF1A05|nr:TlpA disulfide reductase family protein [Chthonobacter rhizosphaerae]
MAETSRRGGSLKIAAVAAFAGLLAGLAGVYVTGWGAGNEEARACAGATDVAGRLKPLAVGEVAAFLPADEPADVTSVAFKDPSGAPVTIGSFAGRTVLLNLWATWCAPCRKEMPALNRLQAAHGSDRFEVVAVNIDIGDPAKASTFLTETGITALKDWRDPTMASFNALKAKGLAFGMPTTLLIDPNGCQVGALHGPAEWDSPDAVRLIEAALAG